MEVQIAADLLDLCSRRSYDLSDLRAALHRGHGMHAMVPDDSAYLLVLYLDHEAPWTMHREAFSTVLAATDATRLAMAMVQRGVEDTASVARVLFNLMEMPSMDPRTAHVLCNILPLLDVDALVDRLLEDSAQRRDAKHRLHAATAASKRTRLRICRAVVADVRAQEIGLRRADATTSGTT